MKGKERSYLFGLQILVLFCIVSAMRDVLAGAYFAPPRGLNVPLLTWISAASTAILFYVKLSISQRRLYRFEEFRALSSESHLLVGYLNLGNALVIACTFLAVYHLTPVVANLGDAVGIPLATAFVAMVFAKEKFTGRWISGMTLAGVSVTISTLLSQSGEVDKHGRNVVLGVSALFMCCIAFALNQFFNKRLVQIGVRRDRLVLARMPIAVMVTPIWWYVSGASLPHDPSEAGVYLAIALGGVALPLYLLAYAFEYVSVRHVAAIMFVTPVLVFFGTCLIGGPLGPKPFLTAGLGILVMAGVAIAEFKND